MQFVRTGTRLSVGPVSADILPTMQTVVPEQCALLGCEPNSRPVVRATHKQTMSAKTHVQAADAVSALINTPE